MAGKGSITDRFMRATGKARMIFGPAQRSSVNHAMTEDNKRLLEAQQAEEKAKWETVTRADGGSYILPRKTD